jgi:hypothetical protein
MTSDKNETARMAGFVDVDQVQLSSPAFCFSTGAPDLEKMLATPR